MQIVLTILTVLDVICCLLLILLILLQSGKGSDVGSMLGGAGASSSLFGPTGGKNIIVRITAVVATLFFVITVALAKLPAVKAGGESIADEIAKEEALSAPATLVTPEKAVVNSKAPVAVKSIEATKTSKIPAKIVVTPEKKK